MLISSNSIRNVGEKTVDVMSSNKADWPIYIDLKAKMSPWFLDRIDQVL